jgi:hypothetical protein
MKFKDFEILKIDIDLTDEGFRTVYWQNKHNHLKRVVFFFFDVLFHRT